MAERWLSQFVHGANLVIQEGTGYEVKEQGFDDLQGAQGVSVAQKGDKQVGGLGLVCCEGAQ